MNYVVGFLGHDRTLGRTFFASTMEQAKECMNIILKENHEDTLSNEELNGFHDNCTVTTDVGVYFIGGLEEAE